MRRPAGGQDAGSRQRVPEQARLARLSMNSYNCIADDVKLGANVRLSQFINLYGCEIGDETKIGAFVEIQKNATRRQALQDLQSHLYLRRSRDRRQRLHRPRRDVHQRQLSPSYSVRTESCKPKLTGKSSAPSSGRAHRSVPASPFCPTPPSVKTRLSALAAWSPKMSHPTRSSPAIRRGFCVT